MDLTNEEKAQVARLLKEYDDNYHAIRIRDGLEDSPMMRMSYFSGLIKTLRINTIPNVPTHISNAVLKAYEERADATLAQMVQDINLPGVTTNRLKKRIGL